MLGYEETRLAEYRHTTYTNSALALSRSDTDIIMEPEALQVKTVSGAESQHPAVSPPPAEKKASVPNDNLPRRIIYPYEIIPKEEALEQLKQGLEHFQKDLDEMIKLNRSYDKTDVQEWMIASIKARIKEVQAMDY